MKYKFIEEHKNKFSISRICQVLGVNRSGYYSWLNRSESKRSIENKKLKQEIRKIYFENKCRYGSPKIKYILEIKGNKYGHNRIARLMKEEGLRSIVAKKYKYNRKAVCEENASKNLLNRNFKCLRPNHIWVSDITYIKTKSGWVYLCCFLDLYSRKIVSWSVSKSIKSELVMNALKKACIKRKPNKGLIIHSDRGVQYGSNLFRDFLKRHKFVQSMSRAGNCWDNACIESFFSLIKKEELKHFNFENIDQVKYAIFKYIDNYYNNKRIHSYLEYKTPSEFERQKIA